MPSVIPYTDPWLMSAAARLRMLTAKPRRIAYFYEAPDTSTFRYRAFNMTQCLAANQTCDVSAGWFDHQDLRDGVRFIELADVLVICRARYNAAIAAMVSRARARAIPVLFDCDDLVCDPERTHHLLDCLDLDQTNDSEWTSWYGRIGRLNATFRLCDGFITPNEYLADRVKDLAPGIRTAVVPNYLNHAQQDLSESLHALKQVSGWARNSALHIGYFSGSPTHAKDFQIAAPALARLMRRDPRIVLRVVGFLDLTSEMADLAQRVEFVPLQDFMNLQRLIAEVEINIAPLQDNVFTNCKSELKFFEAAICGTVTIATPTFTFRNAMRDGETGFLASGHQWDDALARAVALVDDIHAYAAVVGRASATVQDTYGWDRQTARITRAAFGHSGQGAVESHRSLNKPTVMDRTAYLRSCIKLDGVGLEIGPSYNPLLPKSEGFNVKTVDYTDADALRVKYANDPVGVSRIEAVDYIVSDKSLADTVGQPGCFDYVVASHVIEHTPDMLGFLKDCETLLKPDGVLCLAIPDKRHCFDVLQPLTSTGAVLQAHIDRRQRPSFGSIWDDRAYNAVRDGAIGWPFDGTGRLTFFLDLPTTLQDVARFRRSTDYVDVHVWRFVPSSFRLIMHDLAEVGEIGLREASFRDSVGSEFYMSFSRQGRGCAVERINLAKNALAEQARIALDL